MKLARFARWFESPWRIAFGPVFQKEVYVSGRRTSTYVVRSSVAILLLIVLTLSCIPMFFEFGDSQGVARLQRSQTLATTLTAIVIGFDFAILMLFTPILIAPAVMEEVRQRTLPALLTTPITAAEIIVGKLFGRGVNLLVLSLIPLPVLLVLRSLGGVPGDVVLMALAMIVSATAMIGSLSILISVRMRRPASAIVASYIFFAAIQGIPPILLILCVQEWKLFSLSFDFMFAFSVFPSLIGTLISKLAGEGGLPFDVETLWIWNSLYNLGVSVLLLLTSILMLRRVMRREGAGEPAGAAIKLKPAASKRKSPPRSVPATEQVIEIAQGVRAARCSRCGYDVSNMRPQEWRSVVGTCPECGSQLDWTALDPHPTRTIGDQPVLWRELRQPIFKRRWQWGVAAAAAIALVVFIFSVSYRYPGEGMKAVLAIILVLGLLSASVMTTNAIGIERDSQTWDVLLTTGLSANEILWGKLLGTLRRQAFSPGLGAIFLLICGMLILDVTHPFEVLFWILLIGGPICFLSASGVVLSLIFRKSTVAAVWNLSIALMLWAGLPAVVGVVCYPIERTLLQSSEISDKLISLVLVINPVYSFGVAINGGSMANVSYWQNGTRIHLEGNNSFNLFEYLGISLAVAAAYVSAAWFLMYAAKTQFSRLSGRISTGTEPSKSVA